MIFTGSNLQMVRRGIELAIDELRTQIGTCQDVMHYKADLDELEQERAAFMRLLARINQAIEKEGKRN